MKSAIGIGTLLADGVGDTIRVSLTEDPEFEYEPCNRLAEIAESRLFVNPTAASKQSSVEGYEDTRDIQSFEKRQGDLPTQVETDQIDARGFLHRDGSVIAVVTPEVNRMYCYFLKYVIILTHSQMLKQENVQYLYQELGCKLAVGMPFKDIATVDSLLMRTFPPSSAVAERTHLRRLIEVSTGVIVPAAELEKDPMENTVALMTMTEAIEKGGKLPEGAIRLAIELDGKVRVREVDSGDDDTLYTNSPPHRKPPNS